MYILFSALLFSTKFKILLIPLFLEPKLFIIYPLLLLYLPWGFFSVKKRLQKFYFTIDFENQLIIYTDNMSFSKKGDEKKISFDQLKEIIVYKGRMIKLYEHKASAFHRIGYLFEEHEKLIEELGRIIPLTHKRRSWDNMTFLSWFLFFFMIAAVLFYFLV